MNYGGKLPVIVGVTGHIHLNPACLPAAREQLSSILRAIRSRCPATPVLMLNSLAAGSDTLCGLAAAEEGIPLIVPLPMEAGDYREDFAGEDLSLFDHLIAGAEDVFVSPRVEPLPAHPGREDLYRQAGLYIAKHATVLLSLWDGQPSAPCGVGTAAITESALSGVYAEPFSSPFRHEAERAVIRVPVARQGQDAPECAPVWFHEREMWDAIDAMDAFNRQVIPSRQDDQEEPNLRAVYREADRLSCHYNAANTTLLKLLAACGTLLTLAFLLYDELEMFALLPLCGLMLASSAIALRLSRRTHSTENYVEYRALAEAARVQDFLASAGSSLGVADLLSWTQREEIPWIACALNALSVISPAGSEDVRRRWMEEQRTYHAAALIRMNKKVRISAGTVRVAVSASIAAYILALVAEGLSGGILGASWLLSGHMDGIRTGIKVALGSFSAATLFVSDYYGKLSLDQEAENHRMMTRLFDRALELGSEPGREALLAELAREELLENGNWVVRARGGRPELGL